MKHRNEHIKQKYLDWSEDRLPETEKKIIDKHLSECSECKTYYNKMNTVMSYDSNSKFTELEPDTFLATRIKALVKDEENKTRSGSLSSYLRWLFISLASCAAIFIGITLGQGLYNRQNNYNNKSNSIVSSYYSVYSQEGISDNFESVLSTGKENK